MWSPCDIRARVAHAFNLTLVKASDVPAIRNALGVVSTVATFFRSSSVRTKKLDECVASQEITAAKHRLKIPCQTRWVEKHEAIHTLYKLYGPVCEVLLDISQVRGPASSDARALLTSLTNNEFVVSLCVLNSVMTVTMQLSQLQTVHCSTIFIE